MIFHFEKLWIPSLAAAVFTSWRAEAAETPLPVVAKFQMIYSLVGHYNSVASRVSFYNSNGNPAGNINYGVPHLVYEPIVTLYNPYNTTLTLTRSRVKFSNPPVGFRFKKNSDYLRTGGGFCGLGQFQIANENNPTATKTFTMILGGGTPDSYAGNIVLQPGESKAFMVRVQTSWTWGYETSLSGQNTFFDTNNSLDFTNKDYRTNNLFGVECVAGLSFRAGFQTDHLSLNTRPAATLYGFEQTGSTGGWVAIKNTDTVSVEATGMNTNALAPGFELSLLKGVNANAAADIAKTYPFSLASLTPAAGSTVISRTFTVNDILQTPSETTSGGKHPFALFTIVAKSKALQEGRFQSTVQPASDQLYESSLTDVDSFTSTKFLEGPSDLITEGIVMNRMERIGDLFVLDVAAPNYSNLKVKGTADLSNGFTEDLTSVSTITPGPEGTGIYKVSINVAGRGPNYFVRVEL